MIDLSKAAAKEIDLVSTRGRNVLIGNVFFLHLNETEKLEVLRGFDGRIADKIFYPVPYFEVLNEMRLEPTRSSLNKEQVDALSQQLNNLDKNN